MKFCIYLKRTEPDVSFVSEEHIFPAGIGGIQKLPLEYVSHECNNAFSAMELSFMRNSLIAIPRQFYGPGKRGKLSSTKATKSNVCLMSDVSEPSSIKFGYISLGKPYSISQLKIHRDGKCEFISDNSFGDINQQTSNFIKNLEGFNGKYDLYENEAFTEDEFIIGYHEGRWYVALSNRNLEAVISSFIDKLIEQKPFENQTPNFGTVQPKVHQTLQFDDRHFRVSAKIMLNYLAFVKGQDFVLRSCFDPLREWIVKGGENKFSKLSEKESNQSITFPDLAHKLFIIKSGKSLIGVISFYDGSETIVNLCNDFEESFFLEGFICDWKNRQEYSFLEYINKKGS